MSIAIPFTATAAADEPKPAAAPRESRSQVWLGVALRPLEDEERAKEGPGAEARLVVDRILPDSPAAKAGLKAGDLILAIGDHRIEEFSKFLEIIGASEGKTLKLKLARDGKIQTVEVKPAKRPAAEGPSVDEQREVADKATRQLQEARARLEKLLQGQLKQQPAPQQPNPPANPAANPWQVRPRLQVEGLVQPPARAIILAAPSAGLPNDMEVTIQRKGKEPARITVKQGHREWRTIETDLEMLPPEARQYLARLLGPIGPPRVGAAIPARGEAIELELKLGPGGVIEGAESRESKGVRIKPEPQGGLRFEIREHSGGKPEILRREIREEEAASPSDEKSKEEEAKRLRDEILKLHRELQDARKAWNDSLEQFIPAPPTK